MHLFSYYYQILSPDLSLGPQSQYLGDHRVELKIFKLIAHNEGFSTKSGVHALAQFARLTCFRTSIKFYLQIIFLAFMRNHSSQAQKMSN